MATTWYAGRRILASQLQGITPDSGHAASNYQDADGTTTSLAYTGTLTGGTRCGLTFKTLDSGLVIISNVCVIKNSTSGRSLCAWELRTGAVVGSGTLITPANDATSLMAIGTNESTASRAELLIGLTPNTSYNLVQVFRASSGTATFNHKSLTAVPI